MATRTCDRTLLHPDLTKATIKLLIYKTDKYDVNNEEYEKVEFTGVKSWTIVEGGAEAEAIEKILGYEDKYHTYLVLNYADGHTEIYQNTKVAMFII